MALSNGGSHVGNWPNRQIGCLCGQDSHPDRVGEEDAKTASSRINISSTVRTELYMKDMVENKNRIPWYTVSQERTS